MKSSARDTLDAIRLALEGGADDASRVRLIRELVDAGPPARGSRVEPVRLLTKTIRRLRARLVVA
jgi:hypothetical protein